MSYNYIKTKTDQNCPDCGSWMILPMTREKDETRRRFYLQSKKTSGGGESHPIGQIWLDLEDIQNGTAQAKCRNCNKIIGFEIHEGQIIGSRIIR